jgi:hypothetical protein
MEWFGRLKRWSELTPRRFRYGLKSRMRGSQLGKLLLSEIGWLM